MLSYLNIYNMSPIEITNKQFGDFFTITTCQRTLIIGLREVTFNLGPGVTHIKGSEAYGYLLETITGLKSQFPAENEIVCQFKDAFKKYIELSNKDTRIIQILEKLFKDNKDIRSNYLKNIGQHSYTGIAKKILKINASSNKILILGSGNLAMGLLKMLSKKFEITLSARNLQKVSELKKNFKFEFIPWPNVSEYINYPNILSTIGAYKTYFNDDFFSSWLISNDKKGLFIDLGSPSTIETKLSIHDGIYRLFNIFNECKALSQEKELKIINAKNAIKEIVDKRVKYFKNSSINITKDSLIDV